MKPVEKLILTPASNEQGFVRVAPRLSAKFILVSGANPVKLGVEKADVAKWQTQRT